MGFACSPERSSLIDMHGSLSDKIAALIRHFVRYGASSNAAVGNSVNNSASDSQEILPIATLPALMSWSIAPRATKPQHIELGESPRRDQYGDTIFLQIRVSSTPPYGDIPAPEAHASSLPAMQCPAEANSPKLVTPPSSPADTSDY